MSKQATPKINDKVYVINAFKGLEGWSYLPRLTKYVFPFVTFMFNAEQTEEDLIGQITQLLSGENAKEVEKLILELVAKVQVDGSTIDPDSEFQQNYDALFLLVVEVIKLNYYDSFQRLVMNLPKG
jgi:hypothetical protein